MIPQIGFGTYGVTADQVKTALELGYKMIDCAHWYDNEKEIGQVFSEWFKTHNREDYFIISKLYNDSHYPQNVETALKTTLQDLCLEYLDLYLIHWPIQQISDSFANDNRYYKLDIDQGYGLRDTWRAMEKLVELKLTKHIGVSNYTVQLLMDLFSYCSIKPFCNQVEVHLYYQNDVIVRFCQQNQLMVMAYAPIGGYFGPQKILKDKHIQKMSKKYGKSGIQIALKWHFQKYNQQYTIIPKASTKQKALENLHLDFEIDEDDISYLNTLNINKKQDDPKLYWNFPLFPK